MGDFVETIVFLCFGTAGILAIVSACFYTTSQNEDKKIELLRRKIGHLQNLIDVLEKKWHK